MNVQLREHDSVVMLKMTKPSSKGGLSAGSRQWDAKRDLCTTADLARDLDRPPMQRHNAFDEGEAKTEASRWCRSGRVDAIETVEHVRDVFWWDPRPGVRHLNTERIAVAERFDHGASSWRRVINGILNEVADRTLPQRPIEVRGQVVRSLNRQGNSGVGREGVIELANEMQFSPDLERLP